VLDLHNHILPGLDDGAADWRESLSMARLAAEDGIEGVVCTPHRVCGFFENGRTTILDAVQVLKDKLARDAIPLAVYPGCELRLHHDIPGKIVAREVLTLNDNGRYALIELPDEVLPRTLEHFFRQIQERDITPVISHPERNPALMREPMRLYKLVEMGSLLQVTSSSVLGGFGREVQRFAVELLEHRLVHVIATDSHGPRRRSPKLSECYAQVASLLGEETARRLFQENPGRIIHGEPVTPIAPIPFGAGARQSSLWKKLFSLLGNRE
jgi:protein-tyrosine phosphatase